ncbi:MAG: trypsin-like peptidase domain-containing protein [Lewinellaceae bacterium]|nr:trypsin-like peptidase domain-containing protein [Lewinellaceae bacterium]
MHPSLRTALIAVISSLITCCLFWIFIPQPHRLGSVGGGAIESSVHLASLVAELPKVTEWEEQRPLARKRAELLNVDFVEASRAVMDGVVNINVLDQAGNRISSGSGVVYSADGYIITNDHVIGNGLRFEVTFSNKRQYAADLIGLDPHTDLALLKVDAVHLTPLHFGDSDDVQVGEWVLAVGNPFNLASTVTAGIVSAKGRNINILPGIYAIESFIQTDAAVNPGNSGGALVNVAGELIGINTAIISESGSYEGYSFAIPANLVQKVIQDLKAYGMVQRGILGVTIEDIDGTQARKLGLKEVKGVLVTSVTPGSGADLAGLRNGDVILRVNGMITPGMPQLQEVIARFRPGDKINMEYYRHGRNQAVNVTLQKLSESPAGYH